MPAPDSPSPAPPPPPPPPAAAHGLQPALNGGAGGPAAGPQGSAPAASDTPPGPSLVVRPNPSPGAGAGAGAGAQPRSGPQAAPAVNPPPPAAVLKVSTAASSQMRAPRLAQTSLPVLQNIQVPAGMVLVRSDSGQLVLVPQKAFAQAQAKARAQAQGNTATAAPTSTHTVRISNVQANRTPTVASQVKPPGVQQVNQLQAPVQTNTVPQRITLVQSQPVSGAITGKSITTVSLKPSTPANHSAPAQVAQTSASPETLENVKKCKNFLATLIKLASSGSQSMQMSNNVKTLVQNLLDGKLEAEEFTSQLYQELKSSPQPYLVPFLKRSLPALRKLMPNSQAFIQQCLQKPATPATTLATVSGLSKPPNLEQAVRTVTATSAAQQAKPLQAKAQMVVQQSGALTKTQESILPRTQTVTLQRPLNHITVPVSQIQVKAIQGGPVTSVVKVPTVQANGNSSVLVHASTDERFKKEVGGTSFRDEDDINDVASMAGVNINEENARILATNSELVGAVIRSCKEETFLSSVSLQKKTLEIGKKHGVTEVNSDVLSTISHATQEHLRELVEKLTVIAQHRMKVYKDNDQYSLSSDTRSQLKFFEQLDRLEKQRKDEDERETMLRLAKSRAKHEDPEQLRLKQRAKEMQQLELAQLAQREANLAALAAIGPRKRKTPDSPSLGTGSEGLSSGGNALGVTRPPSFLRQRVTRVNLRDLLLCLEQDRATNHSLLLYRAYLK
ncbi:transcription initiation factor TFIID subunit 4-like isoform X2 [Pristis pectinata]|uniref:transcription initiation factor TFIID subunit 4-like isoform X2 n=1 Tax=Pristis pectinata TaxID=685728 RepID=UPI00223DC146|nr:transcription initiation factor TFIID subunit 4-like isoform X2 [Pristis pectinata]